MENRNSSKPVLSSICFIVAAFIAVVSFVIGGLGVASFNFAEPPMPFFMLGSLALIAAAIAARSVEGR